MTCAEYYETDSTFRAGVDYWAAERRCPLTLVDWLLEHDRPAAAEGARWAATAPEAHPPSPFVHKGEDPSPCGPYPTLCAGGWIWHSFKLPKPDWVRWASFVEERRVRPKSLSSTEEPGMCRTFPTPAAAIVHLLDNWVV